MQTRLKNTLLVGSFIALALLALAGVARNTTTVDAAGPVSAQRLAPLPAASLPPEPEVAPVTPVLQTPIASPAPGLRFVGYDPQGRALWVQEATAPVAAPAPAAAPAAAPASTPVRYTSARTGSTVQKRSTGKSVAIVAGSAGAGAGIGALAGGGKGAGIGAATGGVAGFIYDRLTFKKRR